MAFKPVFERQWLTEEKDLLKSASSPPFLTQSVVKVQIEFVGMGSGIDRFDLFFHLVIQPLFNDVFSENVSFQKEFVIRL